MYSKSSAVVFERPKQAVLKEIRLPDVDDETIVVRTRYSGLSTGTEMKVYNGITGPLGGNLWYPLIPGYEEVGEVVFVGDKAAKTYAGEMLKIGDRVMANEVRKYPEYCAAWGGQVEHVVKNRKTAGAPFDRCALIPDGVTYQEAVVAYLACVAKKGIDKAAIKQGETILVIGMGNVGLSALQLAKLAGAGKVIAMDVTEPRLKRAKKFTDLCIHLGKDIEAAVQSLAEMTDNRLADVVIEASGSSASVAETYRFVREGGWENGNNGGRIHLQGEYPDPIIINPYWRWFNKNLTISTSCAVNPGDKEAILALIRDKKFDAQCLITREMPIQEAPAAYDLMNRERDEIPKILFSWR